jgi:error-prone DNA polymerase
MTERGIDQDVQDKVTANIMAFANYGFPESHAASFALLTYASAWLKVHYLAEFTAAMLNNYPLGFYAPATLVKDAQRHGLHFRPVDINRSQYLFTIEDGDVRVGLRYVKGLREEVGEAIVAERGSGFQTYTSIDDLVSRVPEINKKEIRALSLAGALNFDNSHRRQALWESELAIQPTGKLFKDTGRNATTGPLRGHPEQGQAVRERASSQPNGTLIDTRVSALNANFIHPMTEWQRMEADLLTTSITIGKHPMAFLREELKQSGIISAEETFKLKPRDIVSVAGSVIVRQRPSTAKDVVFMTMEDETGYSNFLILPDTFDRFRSTIVSSNFLVVRGIHEQRGMIKALYFQPINAFITKIASHDFQ